MTAVEDRCNHLEGTWRRAEDGFVTMTCKNGPECYQIRFNPDSEAGYQLFEIEAEVYIGGKKIE
jgi:hypothetical protein